MKKSHLIALLISQLAFFAFLIYIDDGKDWIYLDLIYLYLIGLEFVIALLSIILITKRLFNRAKVNVNFLLYCIFSLIFFMIFLSKVLIWVRVEWMLYVLLANVLLFMGLSIIYYKDVLQKS
jgi:hypothetical protein